MLTGSNQDFASCRCPTTFGQLVCPQFWTACKADGTGRMLCRTFDLRQYCRLESLHQASLDGCRRQDPRIWTWRTGWPAARSCASVSFLSAHICPDLELLSRTGYSALGPEIILFIWYDLWYLCSRTCEVVLGLNKRISLWDIRKLSNYIFCFRPDKNASLGLFSIIKEGLLLCWNIVSDVFARMNIIDMLPWMQGLAEFAWQLEQRLPSCLELVDS